MEASPEKRRVSKLYLLVHPGITVKSDNYLTPGHPDKEDIKNFQVLKDRYIEKAKQIGDSDLLVVFGAFEPDEIPQGSTEGALYADCLKALEKILGDRMILIEGNIDPFTDSYAYEEVEFIADERGFQIGPDTETEAFGESAAVCVNDCAQNFNATGKLRKRTVIDLDLTDLYGETPDSEDISALIEESRNNLSRVVYRKNGKIL